MMLWLRHFLATILLALAAFGSHFDQASKPASVANISPMVATSTSLNQPPQIAATSSLPLPKPIKKTISPEATNTPATSSPILPQTLALLPQAAVNTTAREAVVNIFCTISFDGQSALISGSGIIISPSGVILTAAHIGQYFLLQEYAPGSFSCVVRTGSPAVASYQAKILSISSNWIEQNPDTIASSTPTGTGEDDFALLEITGSANSSPLPASFPYLPYDTVLTDQTAAAPILVVSYPAEFLGSSVITQDLFAVSTTATINTFYTFGTATPDLMSLGSSIDAQEGSSGGAVISLIDGHVVGLVVTALLNGTSTSSHDLRALSLDYINRAFAAQNGESLPQFVAGDLQAEASVFDQTLAPQLASLLEKNL